MKTHIGGIAMNGAQTEEEIEVSEIILQTR